jgi:transposase
MVTLQEKLVCTWSEKRERKDRNDRERGVEKAMECLERMEGRALHYKRGYHKYFDTDGREIINGIDIDRIEEEKKYDGFYAIQTSTQGIKPDQILDAYHQLYKIEESFRVIKSTMKARPVFHWTEKRIRGHFVICFLAFLLGREVEIQLKKQGVSASPERIKEALNSLEVCTLNMDGEKYLVKSACHPLATQILNAMRIKHIRNVAPYDEADTILSL